MDAQTNCYGNLTEMNILIETLSNLMGNAELTRNVAVALLATAIFLIGLAGLLILAHHFDPLRKRLDTLTSSTTTPRRLSYNPANNDRIVTYAKIITNR